MAHGLDPRQACSLFLWSWRYLSFSPYGLYLGSFCFLVLSACSACWLCGSPHWLRLELASCLCFCSVSAFLVRSMSDPLSFWQDLSSWHRVQLIFSAWSSLDWQVLCCCCSIMTSAPIHPLASTSHCQTILVHDAEGTKVLTSCSVVSATNDYFSLLFFALVCSASVFCFLSLLFVSWVWL